MNNHTSLHAVILGIRSIPAPAPPPLSPAIKNAYLAH